MDTEAPSDRERRWVGRLVRAAFLRDRRAGPWPVPCGVEHRDLRLRGNSGADLAARWFPAAEDRGAVVLAHPDRRYAQHWFVREGWIELLHRAGFGVLTFDFPGYGASHGGSTYFFEDVLAAVEAAQARTRGPVHVAGLSMGAFAAMNAAPRLHGVEGLVLESPYPSFNAWYGRGRGRWAMEAFDALFPRSAALIQGDRNIAQAVVGRILIAGTPEDQVTRIGLTRAVAQAAPVDRTRVLELPGLEHLALFRESARYREAVLETFGVPEDEASALVRPSEIPAPEAARGQGARGSPRRAWPLRWRRSVSPRGPKG